MAAPDALQVEVCLLEAGGLRRERIALPAGATVAAALAASRLLAARAEGLAGLSIAVFGLHADPSRLLVDGDRIELLPPLSVDPKLARRRRADRKRRERGDVRWEPGRG
jgi:uncharacterized protein